MASLLQIHTKAWKNCQRCPLYKERKNVCICRGTVPADVLFTGEGPGESEDVFGLPFFGPAGKLLDQIIERAKKQAAGETIKVCFTNLVGCIPKTESPDRKKVEPLPSEIAACYPRLDAFIDICKPKLIVAVGDLADKYGTEQKWYNRAVMVKIIHPAAILRQSIAQRPLTLQRTEITLRDAFRDVVLDDIPLFLFNAATIHLPQGSQKKVQP